ncbi:ephrin type-B receptor 3-like, partial [Leucoraja erinacea]|uniref:ephrin type-B receptor 3-like n=1 Tax=Leucoraja erinaceus TaxID=7782 RepID=UPI002457B0DB
MELWLHLSFLSTALALDEVLMDTQMATEELNWLAVPSSGWEETVAVDTNFNTIRTHRVCNMESPNQDNWLRSGFIGRGEARLVYVDLRFTMRDCRSFQSPCRETFSVYHREADSEGDVEAPGVSGLREDYAKAGELSAELVFTLGEGGGVNRATVAVGPLSKAGFRLAFRDRGACANLLSVRAYYRRCPPAILGLARFAATATGPAPTSLLPVGGSCVDGAQEADTPPTMHCSGEGHWLAPAGACRCRPGYRGNQELTACTGNQGLHSR